MHNKQISINQSNTVCQKKCTIISLGEGQLIFWYGGPAAGGQIGPPNLKNFVTIFFFFTPPPPPRYLWNYWSHRNGSPINVCRNGQGMPWHCSGNNLYKHFLLENKKLMVNFLFTNLFRPTLLVEARLKNEKVILRFFFYFAAPDSSKKAWGWNEYQKINCPSP